MLYLWTQDYPQIVGTCPGQLISQNCVLTKIRVEPRLKLLVLSAKAKAFNEYKQTFNFKIIKNDRKTDAHIRVDIL